MHNSDNQYRFWLKIRINPQCPHFNIICPNSVIHKKIWSNFGRICFISLILTFAVLSIFSTGFDVRDRFTCEGYKTYMKRDSIRPAVIWFLIKVFNTKNIINHTGCIVLKTTGTVLKITFSGSVMDEFFQLDVSFFERKGNND